MKNISHIQVQRWVLAGQPAGADDLSLLQAHLHACRECRRFAALSVRLSAELATALPERHFSAVELRHRSQNIQAAVERNRMKKPLINLFKTAGWVVAAAVFLFGLAVILRPFIPGVTQPGGRASATPSAEPTTTIEPAPTVGASTPETMPVTPLSDLLAFESTRDGNLEIYIAEVPDSAEVSARLEWNLTQNPADDRGPAWSPDGSQIAFISDRTGYGDVFVVSVKGGEARQLTDLGAMTMMPANPEIAFRHLVWSPDGSQVAASLGNNIGGDVVEPLYLIAADGSGAQVLTDGHDVFPAWSPDGTKLAFTRLADSLGQPVEDIFTISPDGSGLENISKISHWTDGNETGPAVWSPDGVRLAYSSAGSEDFRLIVHPVGSAATIFGFPPELNPQGGIPAWSPDGSLLVYLLQSSEHTGLYLMEDDGNNLTVKFSKGLEGASDLVWDSNSSWLSLVAPGPTGEQQILLANLEMLSQDAQYAVFPLTFTGENSHPRWQPQVEPESITQEEEPAVPLVISPLACNQSVDALAPLIGLPERPSHQLGFGTLESGNFVFDIGLYCDPSIPGPEEASDAAHGDLAGIGFYYAWYYKGETVHGDFRTCLGSRCDFSTVGPGLTSFSRSALLFALSTPEETESSAYPSGSIPLRYDLVLTTSQGMSGATIRFVLEPSADGYILSGPFLVTPLEGEAPAQIGGPIEIKIPDNGEVNCRSGPGTTFDVATTLPVGTEATAIGVSSGGDWVLLVVRGVGSCWIYRDLLAPDLPFDNLPILQP